MSRIWSTGPAHVFVGVSQRLIKPPPAPDPIRSLSEVFANMGGGVRENQKVPVNPPANANPFDLRIASIDAATPVPPVQFGMMLPFDIRPRQPQQIQPGPDRPANPGPLPEFISKTTRAQQISQTTASVPNAPPKKVRVPEYLGTAEKAPIIEIEEASEPWFTDEGGNVNPVDDIYAGMSGTVTVLVTRFRQFTLDRLLSRPNPVTGRAGHNNLRDFGEMAGLEWGGFPLYIVFPNAGLTIYRGMPSGYRFWFAKLVSSQIIPGTQSQKAALKFSVRQAWQATRHTRPEAHAPVERNAIEAVLFDYDCTAISGGKNIAAS